MTTGNESTVAVLGTGGTIQNTVSGRMPVGTLLTELAKLEHGDAEPLPDLVEEDVFTIGSEDLRPTDWVTIARRVQSLATDPSVSGVVVTHGTYTAEETSYFLHLCVRTRKPIVLTCSQRRHGVVGNDGDRNLVDAIRVASCAQARELGCVLVAGEEIHTARDVRKTSQRPGGFNSGALGPVGSVELDMVSIYRVPTRRHTFRSELAEASMPAQLPAVEIVNTYPGASPDILLSAVAAGADGIVLNGFTPSGSPTREQEIVLHEIAGDKGIPVVAVGRGRWGRVPRPRSRAPWLTGDNLSAYKARVLLMVAIAIKPRHEDLQRAFDEY